VSSFYVSEHAMEGDVCVIRVGGYVDFDAAPQFKRCLVHRIEQGDRVIVVDLSEAGFIDSTAIGVLVGALRRLREVGGSLSVVCVDEDVRGIFEIVGLDSLIPMYRSPDEAVAALVRAA
jgi:anti-sigma B factor antagonist